MCQTVRGLVVSARHWSPCGRKPVVRSKKARGAVTYVVLICDDSTVQRKLPQFILGNEHRLTRALLASAEAERPANAHVWREKSSWNNHLLMCRILRTLALSLRTWAPDFQPVLILGVASCHLHPTVMQTASSLGIWLHYIPAKLTFLLQPLDTHCFAMFKMKLRRRFNDARRQCPDGQVTPLDWLRILMSLSNQVLGARPWKKAFQQNGLGSGGFSCRRPVQKLQVEIGEVGLSGLFPSTPDLAGIWPKSRCLDYARSALLRPLLQQFFEDGLPAGELQPTAAPALSTGSSSSEAPVSIALASHVHARACRRYPARASV